MVFYYITQCYLRKDLKENSCYLKPGRYFHNFRSLYFFKLQNLPKMQPYKKKKFFDKSQWKILLTKKIDYNSRAF